MDILIFSSINAICLAIAFAFLLIAFRYYREIVLFFTGTLKNSAGREEYTKDTADKIGRKEERRRTPRANTLGESVVAKVMTDGRPQYLKVMNISAVGALLRSYSDFDIGDKIDISLYVTLSYRPVDIRARIVRLEEVHDIQSTYPVFDIGVEFLYVFGRDAKKFARIIRKLLFMERAETQ